ncbi:MAG: DUF2963 domain-containing protein [Vigna little leaf phytoplasma]|nr:DUF2963 domain-containing protein [Vigna little leaf phytoplasma]
MTYCKSYGSENGTKAQEIYYQPDGQTIHYIIDCLNNYSGNKRKIVYQADGQTIDAITDYDGQTERKIKKIQYQADGKKINFKHKYAKDTGNIVKHTRYQVDGKTVHYVIQFNPKIRNQMKTIMFYDAVTQRLAKQMIYKSLPR